MAALTGEPRSLWAVVTTAGSDGACEGSPSGVWGPYVSREDADAAASYLIGPEPHIVPMWVKCHGAVCGVRGEHDPWP